MGPSVVARSIQALEDLRAALTRFSQDATAALAANDGEIRSAESYLAQRERYWQSELRSAQAELQRANGALQSCQAAAAQAAQSGKGGVSCDREAAAVRMAQARCEQIGRNLAETQRLVGQLHEEVGVYQRSAQSLRTVATADAPRAATGLARHIAALREAAQTGPSGVGGMVGGVVGALGGVAAGAIGAAIGGILSARGAQPQPPVQPNPTATPAPAAAQTAGAAVDALQARVDTLRARDAEEQQTFFAAQEVAASGADDDARTAEPPSPEQDASAYTPPGPTPEAPPATEADHLSEGPPGDPHRRL
jgi:hypothetical protein